MLLMLKYREFKPWHGRFGLIRARVLGLSHQHHNRNHENLRIRIIGRYPGNHLNWIQLMGIGILMICRILSGCGLDLVNTMSLL